MVVCVWVCSVCCEFMCWRGVEGVIAGVIVCGACGCICIYVCVCVGWMALLYMCVLCERLLEYVCGVDGLVLCVCCMYVWMV